MQEELENRTVTLMVSGSKFTGRTLKAAVLRFLSYSRNKAKEHKNVVPHGKQSVKQLIGQNEGVMNEPMGDDAELRTFKRIARKYNVDYAVKRVSREDGENKYLIFFKARDKDTITAAMVECAREWRERSREDKQSVRGLLEMFRKRGIIDRDRAVHREISR